MSNIIHKSSSSAPTFSVIVPAYNAEKTLRRCVDSILAQTFSDFELILINDGSTDSTPAIIDEYTSRDPRVIAIHQPNSGVSSARNAGLDRACGEYIAFVDSDDWIKQEYLKNFLRSEAKSDLVISGFQTFGYRTDLGGDFCNETFYDNRVLLEKFFHMLPLRTPWSKVFKLKIIEQNNLRFRVGMRIGEDTEFVLRYISYCITIETISGLLYQYFVQKDRKENDLLTAEEYKNYLEAIESAMNEIAECTLLPESHKQIREIFKYKFEIGLWYNGISFARKSSMQWFRYRLWRLLPNSSITISLRYSIKMLLWPLLYWRLIRNNLQ